MGAKCIVIGAGFSGLSAATYLAKAGFDVHVYEKHAIAGGRGRYFESKGFTFDMGPSWYWMPDLFEKYFANFGKKVSDYYQLERLDPSYEVIWKERSDQIPANLDQIKKLFEGIEKGAGANLDAFLKDAKVKYDVGTGMLSKMPGFSIMEFFKKEFAKHILKLEVFTSMQKSLDRKFKNEELKRLLEFPILFLGGTAKNTPALYSLMNYADMVLGTWFPMGGMYSVVRAMQKVAEEEGVQFHFNAEVERITTKNGKATGICTNESCVLADYVVASCDYHFADTHLLEPQWSNYSEAYWEKKTFAPSCLLYYVGLNTTIPKLQHHSLFFDTDFDEHIKAIYQDKTWAKHPLFYVSNTNKTDQSLAPEGHENLFFLIPSCPGLKDTESVRKENFDLIFSRFETFVGRKLRSNIVYYKEFAGSHLESEYNAYKGNAYGLANTLNQTAIFKPKLKNKKLNNLYYTGQLTVPGPGVPPSLISGQLVAQEIIKQAS